jgi:cell division protein FtsL
MATLPKVFSRAETPQPTGTSPEVARRPALVRNPYALRALPQADIFFYCKKINNSRLVREPDPKSRGACWSAIGVACVVLATFAGVLAPTVANTLAGYKLEALRVEARKLTDERRSLELQEAELLSPDRLERLAKSQNLVTPSSAQVVHLDVREDGAVAMVK